MACGGVGPGGNAPDPYGGGEDDDPFDPPKTPRMVLKEDAQADELTPDTEDNVAEQTDGIFRNFVFHMQTLGGRGGGGGGGDPLDAAEGGDAPPRTLPELTAFPDQPMS